MCGLLNLAVCSLSLQPYPFSRTPLLHQTAVIQVWATKKKKKEWSKIGDEVHAYKIKERQAFTGGPGVSIHFLYSLNPVQGQGVEPIPAATGLDGGDAPWTGHQSITGLQMCPMANCQPFCQWSAILSIILHISNAFSAPCCNAFISVKHFELFCTWNVLFK